MAPRPSGQRTPPQEAPQPGNRSTAGRILVGLILLEALAMLVLGFVLTVELFTAQRQTEVGFPITEAALCYFVAFALIFIARGLTAERRWARAPAITLQLIGLPFAWRLIEFGGIRIALGVPMGLVLLTALVLLFVTASAAAYEPKAGGPDAADGPDRPNPPRAR